MKQDERGPAAAEAWSPVDGIGVVMPAFGGQIAEEDRWNLINFLRAEHSLEAQGV